MFPRRRRVLWTGAAAISALTLGCAAPRPKLAVSNPDPSGKIPAIKLSVQNRDMSAAPQLVKDLEHDDPAVRFYAVQGLQRLTGEDFGYRYFDDEEDRRPALEKWQAWLRGWEAGQREK